MLHPLIIRRLGPDRFRITRADGHGALGTGDVGAAAIRALLRTRDVARARDRLSRESNSPVNLVPLLEGLRRAGMVREADGQVIDGARITLTSRTRHLVRQLDWEDRLTRLLLKHLPPRQSLALVRPLRRRLTERSPGLPSEAQLARRLPRPTEPTAASGLRARHVAMLAEQDVLARMLVSARPAALHRWMEHAVALRGAEHLDQALARGRGVVVALLHHGPFPLVPPKLLSAGYAFHGFHWSTDFAGRDFGSVFRPLEEGFGWAHGEFLGLPDLGRIGTMMRAISSGGIALVMPDFYGSSSPARAPAARSSAVTVQVGRSRVLVHGWVGWLASRTSASVVPARCVAEPGGRYRVELRAPLQWPADEEQSPADAVARITTDVLAALSGDILDAPHAWTFLTRYRSPAPAGVA